MGYIIVIVTFSIKKMILKHCWVSSSTNGEGRARSEMEGRLYVLIV